MPRPTHAAATTATADDDWSHAKIAARPTDAVYAWHALMAMSCDRDQDGYLAGRTIPSDAVEMTSAIRRLASVGPRDVVRAAVGIENLRQHLLGAGEMTNTARGHWQRGMLDALRASKDPLVACIADVLDPCVRRMVRDRPALAKADAKKLVTIGACAAGFGAPWSMRLLAVTSDAMPVPPARRDHRGAGSTGAESLADVGSLHVPDWSEPTGARHSGIHARIKGWGTPHHDRVKVVKFTARNANGNAEFHLRGPKQALRHIAVAYHGDETLARDAAPDLFGRPDPVDEFAPDPSEKADL